MFSVKQETVCLTVQELKSLSASRGTSTYQAIISSARAKVVEMVGGTDYESEVAFIDNKISVTFYWLSKVQEQED